MLKISKMADYSVLVLAHFCSHADIALSVSKLAERLGLNPPTLAKICNQLTVAGILTASRGSHGGYLLAREPATISLYDVVQAVDGPSHAVSCQKPGQSCSCLSTCHLRGNWGLLNQRFETLMRDITVADFADPLWASKQQQCAMEEQ